MSHVPILAFVRVRRRSIWSWSVQYPNRLSERSSRRIQKSICSLTLDSLLGLCQTTSLFRNIWSPLTRKLTEYHVGFQVKRVRQVPSITSLCSTIHIAHINTTYRPSRCIGEITGAKSTLALSLPLMVS